MDEPIEIIDYRGFEINIYYDNFPEPSPREWGTLGKMICFGRRYRLGDDHNFKTQEEFKKWLEENEYEEDKNLFILPLYLYDHSGMTISTSPFSCVWDSGQIGWIYATKEMCKEWGIAKHTRDKIIELLQNEVEIYDLYLRGEVYGFDIKPKGKNKINIGDDNSTWGYYGDEGKAYMITEGKDTINHRIDKYKEKIIENKNRKIEMNKFINNHFAI